MSPPTSTHKLIYFSMSAQRRVSSGWASCTLLLAFMGCAGREIWAWSKKWETHLPRPKRVPQKSETLFTAYWDLGESTPAIRGRFELLSSKYQVALRTGKTQIIGRNATHRIRRSLGDHLISYQYKCERCYLATCSALYAPN